jgi:hypothetical protein
MRKVTENAVKHFKNLRAFNSSNTRVSILNGYATLCLHDNEIASYYFKNAGKNSLIIEDAGWRTNTTKERLNGILEEFDLGYIHQKNFQWYFTNKDGVTLKWL